MIETLEREAVAVVPRDAALRRLYAAAVLAEIPRIIGSLDRNPFRPTYGSFDRQYWHYRTAAFPSEMYQEAVYPLAWAYATDCPGNPWYGREIVRDWAIAALRYSARAAHRDGSCDDYYPYERALGAAVFSLVAGAKAYRLLNVEDSESLDGLLRRARWVAVHQEPGQLTNHHALAALGLLLVSEQSNDQALRAAADARVEQVLAWQHPEGWFAEYDGADPGYQTVTIGCLAEYRQLAGRDELTLALVQAAEFCRWFLHPDGSYGGEYGSRGTYHCYPHGFELLAGECAAAADLADACLQQRATQRQAYFDDDRLFAHRLASHCAAYDHWSPRRVTRNPETSGQRCFPAAGIFVASAESSHTIISAARGGVFKHFATDVPPVTDGGLVIELADGRQGVSQQHERDAMHWSVDVDEVTGAWRLRVARPFHACRWETVTPVKQVALHLGMITLGRWCRDLVRRMLQRRLIASRNRLSIKLERTIEYERSDAGPAEGVLRVIDRIELLDAPLQVRRMAFGVDHQAAYTAATGVYQESVLQSWTDLAEHVEALNRERAVAILREFPA